MISACTINDRQILAKINCSIAPATDNDSATHEILIDGDFAAYIYHRDGLYSLLNWKCIEKYESPESAGIGYIEHCHPQLYRKAYEQN
jgi:hypothetical protein